MFLVAGDNQIGTVALVVEAETAGAAGSTHLIVVFGAVQRKGADAAVGIEYYGLCPDSGRVVTESGTSTYSIGLSVVPVVIVCPIVVSRIAVGPDGDLRACW